MEDKNNDMNDLVISNNGKAITNSLVVAEKFGKQHKHIMQAIKELITSAEKSANLFVESEYPDAYGRMQPMYIMNRDGFSLLVMGFTGGKALEFKLAKSIMEYKELVSWLNSRLLFKLIYGKINL